MQYADKEDLLCTSCRNGMCVEVMKAFCEIAVEELEDLGYTVTLPESDVP
jgi:hypothetical protein